ncbi:MAG: hypothetical protein ACO23R_17405 [bacterium]
MKSFSFHSQTAAKAQHARIIDPTRAKQDQAEQRAKQSQSV